VALLKLLKWKIFASCRFVVVASNFYTLGLPNLGLLKRFSTFEPEPAAAGDVALVAYTSGATGVPKGVVFTNTMVRQQLHIFRTTFGMQPGHKDLPLLPIFSLFNVANGISAVFPPINIAAPLTLDPVKIVHILNELKIDYSFGSPTLWKKISEYCVRSRKLLPSLKSVFIAGAPVSRDTLAQVQEVLTCGKAYTPYGATEALPVTLVSSEDLLQDKNFVAKSGEQGVYVGCPIAEVELRIIAESDQPIEHFSKATLLEPGIIGEVIVSGEHISKSYLGSESVNANSKIQDGTKVWHRMGDVGYLDSDGGLYFCGRKAHRVVLPERTFYSVPTEGVFNQHPKVYRSALVSLGARGAGVVVEPHPQFWPDSEADRAAFIDELKRLADANEITRSMKNFFFHRSFPVDGRHNAKVFNDQLSAWAQEQLRATEQQVR
jgi:acyl-CoA synthetase (AMP-forming)/AMP-acid ligase II